MQDTFARSRTRYMQPLGPARDDRVSHVYKDISTQRFSNCIAITKPLR